MRQTGLPFQVVRDAYVNLLPSDQFEEQETTNNKGDQGQEETEHAEEAEGLEARYGKVS